MGTERFQRPYFKSSIFEFWGGDFNQLNDPNYFKEACRGVFEELGISIIEGPHTSEFEPQGLSLVATFKESHGGFHTWPEFGYARGFLEICSPRINLKKLPSYLSNYFDYSEMILYDLSSLSLTQRDLSPGITTAALFPYYITHYRPPFSP